MDYLWWFGGVPFRIGRVVTIYLYSREGPNVAWEVGRNKVVQVSDRGVFGQVFISPACDTHQVSLLSLPICVVYFVTDAAVYNFVRLFNVPRCIRRPEFGFRGCSFAYRYYQYILIVYVFMSNLL